MSVPRPSAGDVIAGVSVALVLIPQSLAYAEIAGVPPHVGLFAAALPPLIAAPLMSSPYLQTGPVALTSLLTFGALSGLAATTTPEYVELAALLALIVGVSRLLLGLFRMGTIAYLMSQPVLQGFTSAAAILIVSSQLPSMFAVDPDTDGVLPRAWSTITSPGDWSGSAIALTLLTVAVVLGSRGIHKLFPGVLLMVVGATVWSAVTDYTGPTVGDLPDGFITLSLDLPYDKFGDLIIPGIVIALVGFAEPASISRTFAALDRIPWSANRELISSGVANMTSAISGAFPVGGSFSRSSLNRFAGAKSNWSGAVTGAVVIAALPLASNLESLPRAVLGAIVFTAVYRLIQPLPIMRMWKQSAPQAAIATGTFVATLLFSPNVERGVLLGVGLAIGFHLYREMRVDHAYSVDGDQLTVRPSGVVWFASTPGLEDAFREAVAEHPEASHLIVDVGQCGRLDYSGANTLSELIGDLTNDGMTVEFANIPPHAARALAVFMGGSHDVPAIDDLPTDTRYQWIAPWRR
ncbi:MAG: SulP family inorganic anion transporter [Acidimicrobiales bacterium]|jgi:SulP family sulfate permease|nr:SulP family inorganic anion transporter [Acidimicrobiales bacterium]